ncbi:MAG: thiamine pyrophosphate-binding protein [Albidovulum sp.]
MEVQTLRAADVLARRLYAAGCRYAFGMPGGEVLTLIDALEQAGITFVLVRHENSGGFMAEALHHRTGAPGIMVATLGPGALNGMNVVANALQDRVPLIVLTGAVDADEAQTYTHQVLDQGQVFRPVTKASFSLAPNAAQVIADKAIAIAMEGRPGPVHIDVPISAAEVIVPAAAGALRAKTSPVAPAEGPDLARARAALAAALRPVMVVGLDAMVEGAGAAVTEFATRYGIPVITTYKAKGLLDEDHPLALGGAGLSPLADTHLLPLLKAADLILCVGYDPIEMRPGWRAVWDPARVTVIDITAQPNHHYMHHATLAFVADCAASLTALAQGVQPGAVWADGDVARTKAALAEAFPRDEVWGPGAVIAECRDVLPKDAIASADSGAHRILLSQMWTCHAPRALVQSSALCTMGCAVPLAMGTSLAEPDRVAVSFSGDAGFLMVAGELATAKELGLRTIFVVFVDASLALIELKQRHRQMPNVGVDFGDHDIAAIGRAFGGEGKAVRTRDELRAALHAAMVAPTFTVIAAMIDKGAYDGRI